MLDFCYTYSRQKKNFFAKTKYFQVVHFFKENWCCMRVNKHIRVQTHIHKHLCTQTKAHERTHTQTHTRAPTERGCMPMYTMNAHGCISGRLIYIQTGGTHISNTGMYATCVLPWHFPTRFVLMIWLHHPVDFQSNGKEKSNVVFYTWLTWPYRYPAIVFLHFL